MGGPGEPSRSAASGYAVRVSAFYAALFLIYGFHVPYLPMWLDWRGLSSEQIAIVTSAPFFLRLAVTPGIAIAADRYGNHRRMILILAAVGLVASLALASVSQFASIFAAAVVFALTTMTIMPLTETVAIAGVRGYGLDYGRMRLWGSLTFIVIGAGGGAAVNAGGAQVVLPILVAGAAATWAAAFALPAPPRRDDSQTLGAHFNKADILRLVTSPLFLVFLLATGAVQGAHGMFYTFGALHWAKLGISPAWAGALWALAVLAEVVLFAYSARVLAVIGPAHLLIAGATAAVIRWLAMSFDPPLALLFPLQMLHAFTYGATHLAAVHFIHRAVPQSAAGTAQALYATVAAGLMMGAATLACGPLFAAYAGGAYLLPVGLAAAGLLAALYLARRWQGDHLWSPGSGADVLAVTPKAVDQAAR